MPFCQDIGANGVRSMKAPKVHKVVTAKNPKKYAGKREREWDENKDKKKMVRAPRSSP
jgi:hypothetical protein